MYHGGTPIYGYIWRLHTGLCKFLRNTKHFDQYLKIGTTHWSRKCLVSFWYPVISQFLDFIHWMVFALPVYCVTVKMIYFLFPPLTAPGSPRMFLVAALCTLETRKNSSLRRISGFLGKHVCIRFFPECIARLKSVFLHFWENHMQWSLLESISDSLACCFVTQENRRKEKEENSENNIGELFLSKALPNVTLACMCLPPSGGAVQLCHHKHPRPIVMLSVIG